MGVWCLWGMCGGDGGQEWVWDGVRSGFMVWGGKGLG